MYVALFGFRVRENLSLIPNSATYIHQQVPNNICSHTNAPIYFNWQF